MFVIRDYSQPYKKRKERKRNEAGSSKEEYKNTERDR